MRRLGQPPAPTTQPAAAAAPAPPPPQPVPDSPPWQAPAAAPAPAPEPGTSSTSLVPLSGLGAWVPTQSAQLILQGGAPPAEPRLRFATGKGAAASLLPVNTSPGTPYVAMDNGAVAAPGCAVVALAEQAYWATHDDQYRVISAWTAPPSTGRTHKGQRVDECALILAIVLPGSQPLPAQLQPACAVLLELRNAQMQLARTLLQSAAEAASPEWARAHGQIAEALQPRVRQPVQPRAWMQQPRGNGYAYLRVEGTATPISTLQIEALHAWYGSPEGQQEAQEMQAAFTARVQELAQIAAATASGQ